MKTMLFNPFTGLGRAAEDIRTDPYGVLVWEGEEPLRAALQERHAQQVLTLATQEMAADAAQAERRRAERRQHERRQAGSPDSPLDPNAGFEPWSP